MGTDASGDRSSARLQPEAKIPAVLVLGLGVQRARVVFRAAAGFRK